MGEERRGWERRTKCLMTGTRTRSLTVNLMGIKLGRVCWGLPHWEPNGV